MKKKIRYDKNFIENNYNYLKKIIQKSKIFSIENISLGNMPSRKLQFNNTIIKDLNFKIIKKIISSIPSKKSCLSIEPINKKYNVNFLNNHFETNKFINNVNSSKLKLLFDIGNLLDDNLDYKTIYNKYKKSINHIHLSETDLRKFDLNRIDEVLRYLLKQKYKKSVSIEYISDNGENTNEIFKFLKLNYNKYL